MNIEIGKSYNNWTVLKEATELGKGKYLCRCVCGTEKPVLKYNLGVVMGCGCVRKPYSHSGKYIGQKKSKKVKPKATKAIVTKSAPIAAEKVKKAETIRVKPLIIKVDQAAVERRRKIEEIKEKLEFNAYFGELA